MQYHAGSVDTVDTVGTVDSLPTTCSLDHGYSPLTTTVAPVSYHRLASHKVVWEQSESQDGCLRADME